MTTAITIQSLCGNVQGTPENVLDHATTCLTCRTQAQARRAAVRPFARTLGQRRSAAKSAIDVISTYRDRASDEPEEGQVLRLAWGIAHLHRALWHETRGRHGKEHALATEILEATAQDRP